MKKLIKLYIAIKSLVNGLLTVAKHLLKRAVTKEYPEIKPDLNSYFRGKHILTSECTGCEVCTKVCPSDAITIQKNDDNKVTSFKVDLGKCIFCGNCTYYCPQKAISHGNEFELAVIGKDKLTVELVNQQFNQADEVKNNAE